MKTNLKKFNSYKYLGNIIDVKSKRTIEITYLSLTIVALIFFGLFAINPTLSTIANLQKQLSDDQFVDQQLEIKINNLTSLQQSYGNLQPDLPTIYNAIPQSAQAPVLIAQIQSVAKDSNMNILSAQIFPVELDDKLATGTKYGSFTFVILAQGSDANVTSFIDSLAKMQRIISLDQITITQKANDASVFQASIRGSGIYKP